MRHHRTLAAVALVVVTAAPAAAQPADEQRQRAFAAAADEFDVPDDLLLAVSYLESRWDANAGSPSVSAGYGPMHLTDAANAGGDHHEHGEDPRGDTSRPTLVPEHIPLDVAAPSLHTVDQAAELTGISPPALRTDPAANIRGGAALLAHHQRALGPPTDDPADWYGAVARYSGATDKATARVFADEVFAVLAHGYARTTDDGQRIGLDGVSVLPDRAVLDRMGLTETSTARTECPTGLGCEWIPAPYGAFDDTYGNHDKANRPTSQEIDYIVIHDVEGTYDSAIGAVRNVRRPASWHYTLRSSDGHIAQHIATKDVGWHAGNWYVNAKAIGLEHEGFAAQGTWYTEAMYRTSAKLVRYLAERFDVPLDRQHIIGHDNVPGTVPERVPEMHWDPGPYWNWAHYFDLLGAPLTADGGPRARVVMIRPDWATNKPEFTHCAGTAVCPSRSSTSVFLRAAPRDDAPLLKDIGLHPDGGPATTRVHDIGSRVDTGQKFAVAGRSGGWTAIWYLGQKGWLRTSDTVASRGELVSPKPGRAAVPVYGRAYPEASAYPVGITPEPDTPLPYTMPAGQKYVMGADVASEYYKADTFDTTHHVVVRGERYVQIQFGHRFAFVKASDVVLRTDFVLPKRPGPRR